MKRILCIMLCFVLMASVVSGVSSAAVSNRVYSDSVTIKNDKQITIPVKISGNKGFMGFSIMLTYDKNIFTPVSVSKGSLLNGMFDDSISTSSSGSFKVVFSGTQNITGDGVLFNVTFNVKSTSVEKSYINLSYAKQDTFNEKWEDVVLNCEKIETVFANNTTTEPTTEPTNSHEITTKTYENNEDNGKPLSQRMRDWVDSLPIILKILVWIFVVPASYVVELFE